MLSFQHRPELIHRDIERAEESQERDEAKVRLASPRSIAPTRLRCIRASNPKPSWLR
jgi:hypothetical protein